MISFLLAAAVTAAPLRAAEPSAFFGRYRSVVGAKGMVVADDREAAEWGAQILREGGGAVDAAVATGFALAVTRSQFAGLGGGGFLLYCPAKKDCEVLDYRETAPATSKPDMYLKDGKPTDRSVDGALAPGVPGVPAGLLQAYAEHGRLPLERLLEQPIQLARGGFRFSGYGEEVAKARWPAFSPAAKEVFGCDGKPCAPGALIKQPDLARVLQEIARKGAKGFYEGWVAEKIADGVQAAGGILTTEDLRTYAPKKRVPLVGEYKGLQIVTMPPPSSGGAIILQLLRYAELADKAGAFSEGFGSAAQVHAIAEAMALGFADRSRWFGDPDYVRVPVERLLAKDYLDARWKAHYQKDHANIPDEPGALDTGRGLHTTHFSVIDAAGDAVSVTTTLNNDFGSGFMPAGTGVMLNDEMDDFTTAPGGANLFGLVTGKANEIAPGKRPLSSMSPTIARDKDGENRLVLGAMGGPRIISAVFETLLYRLRFGLSLYDAVLAARVHQQWKPASLFLEKFGFAPEVRARLAAMGWDVKETTMMPEEGAINQMHCLERFPDGRVWGAPDARAEGAAVAE